MRERKEEEMGGERHGRGVEWMREKNKIKRWEESE